MVGRYWRGLRRWAHNRFGTHSSKFIAGYGRVCERCFLPLRWDGDRYVLRVPFEMAPPVNRKRTSP